MKPKKKYILIIKKAILASKSVQDGRNIYEKRGGDKDDKRNHSSEAMRASTSKSPELNLDHIDESQHEEHTPGHRTRTRDQHADPEERLVDPDQKLRRVVGGAPSNPHGLLEAHSD